jgi:Flp pilus assembly protein TadD
VSCRSLRHFSRRSNPSIGTQPQGGKRNYQSAIADFSKAIEFEPTNAVAWRDRGIARGAMGDHDKAASAAAEASRLDPNGRAGVTR